MEFEDATRSSATWRLVVPNFSTISKAAKSPPTYIRNLPWKISLMCRSTIEKGRNITKTLAFFLHCNEESKSILWSCNATADLILISQEEGVDNISRKIRHCFNSLENSWGFVYFMTWRDVLDPHMGFIKDDTVIAEVNVKADPPQGISPLSDSKELLASPSVSDDFLALYKNQILTDMILKTETKSFPAHKIVLCARSPVFNAMLTSDMKEKHENCIKIDDLGDDVVQQLLIFLYSDTLESLEWDTATQLYYAADKYQIGKLKDVCSYHLLKNLSTENVNELLYLAHTHSDYDLKSEVEDFILDCNQQVIEFSQALEKINGNKSSSSYKD